VIRKEFESLIAKVILLLFVVSSSALIFLGFIEGGDLFAEFMTIIVIIPCLLVGWGAGIWITRKLLYFDDDRPK